VRATTAFNRMLGIPGATVAEVSFTPGGIVVGLRRRFRKLTCPCGSTTRAAYDSSVRRWRHLDLGSCRLLLEFEIRRLNCRRCGRVCTEQVPWARPGARHTRDFEDVVAFLAQRVDKTTIARLMRASWEAVANLVMRVVADKIDDSRLDDLYRIGVDGSPIARAIAISQWSPITTATALWCGPRRTTTQRPSRRSTTSSATSERPGFRRCLSTWEARTRKRRRRRFPTSPSASIPFHVVQLANQAVDQARRWAWNHELRTNPSPPRPRGRRPNGSSLPPNKPRWVKHTRWALLKDPRTLNDNQHGVLDRLRRERSVLYHCWQLKEAPRDLYRLRRPQDAALHLDWWLAWACRCRIPAFLKLSKTIRTKRDRILAAVELGLSNSKLEGLNSKIRLINHRGYGHHSAAALISMIYLYCGGITVQLPTER
jgi:transposase